MATFNAADIVGKSLIAKKTIDIVRVPDDNAKSVFKVKPGETIGVVYSYLLPNQNRKNLYWMFEDSNGKAYYVEHISRNFDTEAIKQQGALTLAERKEKADAENETTGDKIFRYVKNGFLISAAAYILKTIIETNQKTKTK